MDQPNCKIAVTVMHTVVSRDSSPLCVLAIGMNICDEYNPNNAKVHNRVE